MPLRHPLPFPPIHPPQILLAGATTYIGGTVLDKLLAHPVSPLEDASITCLVRSNECAGTLLRAYGEDINIIVRKCLDDTELAALIASKHDIVINCAPATHAHSALALMEGLANRKRRTGRDVWFLHTSGTENLADLPISGKWVHGDAVKEFDDANDDIYGFETMREAKSSHPQRATELAVVHKGLELGVKTLVIMNPMVYGRGLGLFERSGVRVSAMAKVAMANGKIVVIGDGKGMWDHVHVQELAELYEVVVVEIMKNGGKILPYGKTGIIFSANGRHSWTAVAQEVADVCYEEGLVSQKGLEHVDLTEGIKLFSAYIPQIVSEEELRLCSNAETRSSIARSLGWKPEWGEEFWKQAIRDDVRMALRPEQDFASDFTPDSFPTHTW
ncbi:NAD dependent epimerase/dehydratase family protein [Karstenula rhodostoma CBS 690.94]|uniref:NAD dependent epimerase/dehydratase family protein n=1 Tax=Karstenula rhodostoma CBS 690.94 TaxID=1392251 RepID=A0A9P4UBX9_9PLEO|nr:NAD dependent epimerase/dehydratase family protein [Karstenula rhodostoma CBS 690.94]